MMKNLYLFILLGFVCLSLASCKRGEDDPWLSFVPREKRLEGKWKLESYRLKEQKRQNVVIMFNNLNCDQDGETTNQVLDDTVESAYDGSSLEGEVKQSEGSLGSITSYNVEMTYFLEIRKDGYYMAQGDFSYYNDVNNTSYVGNFGVGDNRWYWVDGKKNKSGIRLIDFPFMDIRGLQNSESPIVYNHDQTFDITMLKSKEMHWSIYYEDVSDAEYISDPYIQYTLTDTIDNCIKTSSITRDNFLDTKWNFVLTDTID